MELNTKYFGKIEIEEERIITFPDGVPGFEDSKEFVIIENPEDDIPFNWLQSIDNPNLAFVIINPFIFKSDYDFEIPDLVVKRLKIVEQKDISVYTIVVVPEDINKMTANLSGPVIINVNKRLGKQIILDDNRYHTKHLILEELKSKGQVK
ncbi:flagellar assembly protein FliW [Clostridiisalibacter paucivorans]|uniref:flagellar assembly protein FliW n=1 Tax=Clostridiisalibacter paucivorans TaxID=408753 RepID=UPI00047B7A25|nr:flagellar assembly protein FliW [Clostridiisalibacter paucivorans]